MESLLNDDTKKALALMSKPLRDRLENVQKNVSDTLTLLEKLQTKLLKGEK